MLSGDMMFGAFTDLDQNGLPAGGGNVFQTLMTPEHPQHADDAAKMDPGGKLHPHSSPVFYLGLIVGGVLLVNYLDRRHK